MQVSILLFLFSRLPECLPQPRRCVRVKSITGAILKNLTADLFSAVMPASNVSQQLPL
jgi:hypothetical protein